MRLRILLFAWLIFPQFIRAQADTSKTSIQVIRITTKDSVLPLRESVRKQLLSAQQNNIKQSTGMRLQLKLKSQPEGNSISRWQAFRNKTNLLQVNLGMLVSEYIGETEKNLEQLFSKAGKSNATLFFDEADALFGKRSTTEEEKADQEKAISYFLKQIALFKGTVIIRCTGEDCDNRLAKLRFIPVTD